MLLQLLQTGPEKARPGTERRPALNKSSGTHSNRCLYFENKRYNRKQFFTMSYVIVLSD